MSRALLRASLTLGFGWLASCNGGGAPPAGAERGQCYPNDTCNPGLTCLSTFCVKVVDGDGGGGSGGGGGHDGGGSDAPADAPRKDAGGVPEAAPMEVEPPFVPAPHPPAPQVITLGGSVLATPKVQPILYQNDARAGDIKAFLVELARTRYWHDTTSEYGVGPLTVLPAITIPTAAPPLNDDSVLRSQLAANTSGASPAWGAADPSVIYLFVIPEGADVRATATATCCDDFGGYHSETRSGSITVPYAVACSCPGFLGTTIAPLDERTTAISHELVEAATDPFTTTNPAFQLTDRADVLWSVVTGGETGDMCAFNDDAAFIPPGSTYMVQRSWSNAAARLMQNPCVPYATTQPYFNSFPALDQVAWGEATFITRGVSIPIGGSKTIDVQLYSSARTKGPWTVTAVDYDASVLGTTRKLTLVLDKSEGTNGDVLHLTITPRAQNTTLQAEAFILISHLGGVRDPDYQTNITMGIVTN